MSFIHVSLRIIGADETEILEWLKLNNLKFEIDQVTILCSSDDTLAFKLKFGYLNDKNVNFIL